MQFIDRFLIRISSTKVGHDSHGNEYYVSSDRDYLGRQRRYVLRPLRSAKASGKDESNRINLVKAGQVEACFDSGKIVGPTDHVESSDFIDSVDSVSQKTGKGMKEEVSCSPVSNEVLEPRATWHSWLRHTSQYVPGSDCASARAHSANHRDGSCDGGDDRLGHQVAKLAGSISMSKSLEGENKEANHDVNNVASAAAAATTHGVCFGVKNDMNKNDVVKKNRSVFYSSWKPSFIIGKSQ